MKKNILLILISSFLCPFRLMSQQLTDIPQSTAEINPQTEAIFFSTKGFKIPRKNGHYQGIQLYQDSKQTYAYISGSSKDRAYLSIVQLNNKAKQKELFIFDNDPYRHAGGIQIYDHYLVVGVEDNIKRTTSKIQIYTLESEPLEPQKLLEIPRNGEYELSTAGAVAMARIDGYYFLMVGSWDCQTLDLYKSNGKPLEDSTCAFKKEFSWKRDSADRSQWIDKAFGSYQNLNLLKDDQGNMFMLGFAQSGTKEVIDVYEIFQSSQIPTNQKIKKILRKEIPLKKTTFKAGGGIFINPQGELSVFACHHHKSIIELVGWVF